MLDGLRQFIADIETGTGGQHLPEEPQVFLAWSDDRGHNFLNPIGQTLGSTGEYNTSVQFQRLGYARDRVWQLQWSTPFRTCLMGAWIDVTPSAS